MLAGGRGRGRAVTGQRRKEGVTPISAARAPLPPAGSAGSEGGRRAGAPWTWASEPLAGAQAERSVGGPGDRTGSSPCAPASTSCFARRGRRHFAAGGGRGAELLARRGSGRGGGGLSAAPGSGCDAPSSAASPPDASTGRGGPDRGFSSPLYFCLRLSC